MHFFNVGNYTIRQQLSKWNKKEYKSSKYKMLEKCWFSFGEAKVSLLLSNNIHSKFPISLCMGGLNLYDPWYHIWLLLMIRTRNWRWNYSNPLSTLCGVGATSMLENKELRICLEWSFQTSSLRRRKIHQQVKMPSTVLRNSNSMERAGCGVLVQKWMAVSRKYCKKKNAIEPCAWDF